MSIIKSFWSLLNKIIHPEQAIIPKWVKDIWGVYGKISHLEQLIVPKWVKNIRNITAQSLLKAAYKLMDIDETARTAGLPFTAKEFEKLLRPAVIEGEKREGLAALSAFERPDFGNMVEVSFGRPHRYRSFFNAEVFDLETGETREQVISMYWDDNMTMEEFQALLDDNAFPFYYEKMTSIKLIDRVAVWHNADSNLY